MLLVMVSNIRPAFQSARTPMQPRAKQTRKLGLGSDISERPGRVHYSGPRTVSPGTRFTAEPATEPGPALTPVHHGEADTKCWLYDPT